MNMYVKDIKYIGCNSKQNFGKSSKNQFGWPL